MPGADKVVHVALFAVATWALARVLPVRVAVALMLVQVAASEVVQATLLPTRSGDVLDALADLLGVGLGWGVWQNRRTPATPRRRP